MIIILNKKNNGRIALYIAFIFILKIFKFAVRNSKAERKQQYGRLIKFSARSSFKEIP